MWPLPRRLGSATVIEAAGMAGSVLPFQQILMAD
jgi:hypothetical protein